jgi:hypothetical protein
MAAAFSVADAVGPVPFDKKYARCLKVAADDGFWHFQSDSHIGQTFQEFVRVGHASDGPPGPVVCISLDKRVSVVMEPLQGALQTLLGNWPVRVVVPEAIDRRDPLFRVAASLRMFLRREDGLLDGDAVVSALHRAVPSSTLTSGASAVLCLVDGPFVWDGRAGTTHAVHESISLLQMPHRPLDALTVLAREACAHVSMLPCSGMQCLFNPGGEGSCLHECPCCLRKLGTITARCPGGLGLVAPRVVGRYRALRVLWGKWISSSPPLEEHDAKVLMQERVWLRERCAYLTAHDVGAPASSIDDPDAIDEMLESPS